MRRPRRSSSSSAPTARRAIRFKRWDGSEAAPAAKVFVIAAHAIETPRCSSPRARGHAQHVANGSTSSAAI
jgi:hypothetical protein